MQHATSRDSSRVLWAFFATSCVIGWALYPILGWSSGTNIPFAPVIAAALVLTMHEGSAGVRAWLARCLRWRAPLRWYALALLFSWIALPLAAVIAVQLGAAPPTSAQISEWVLIPASFVLMFILVGIGEEWGWTGYALPALEGRGAWAWQVGILAVMRTTWHLPLLLTGQLPWPVFAMIVPAQFLWATAWRRSGRLVMVVAVWHASLNSVGGEFLTPMFTGADAMTFAWLWVAAYLALTAAVLYRDRAALRGDASAPVAGVE